MRRTAVLVSLMLARCGQPEVPQPEPVPLWMELEARRDALVADPTVSDGEALLALARSYDFEEAEIAVGGGLTLVVVDARESLTAPTANDGRTPAERVRDDIVSRDATTAHAILRRGLSRNLVAIGLVVVEMPPEKSLLPPLEVWKGRLTRERYEAVPLRDPANGYGNADEVAAHWQVDLDRFRDLQSGTTSP